MAENINKTITVDLHVNNNGQQQIDQYNAALNTLITAVKNLGKPLTDLGNDINILENDLSRFSTAVEKQTAKITATTQKASDQKAKINAASNQKLKASISQEQTMKDKAALRDLQRVTDTYADILQDEDEQYGLQKAQLDKMLNDKKISQQSYYEKSEELLESHRAKVLSIITQMRADNKLMQSDLVAKGTNAVQQPAPPSGDVQKHADPDANKIQAKTSGFVSFAKKALKSLFGSIIGYYDSAQVAITKAAKDGADKTNATVESADKVSQAKKLASAEDNAKKINDSIATTFTSGLDARTKQSIAALEKQKNADLSNANLTASQKQRITTDYQNKENAINAKAFKEKQKISIAQALINGAIAITKSEAELGPIAGTIAIAAIVAETAAQIATINSQRPIAMAKGGYFKSDGKGAVLPGYSRTDNTNAYIRSGEAIVVSEAMRDPWARNLVSAINVAYGGRDFSVPNASGRYAVGGIFTDGGNANRYYNQPVNDQKNLANTVAYQMVNNFPPVYVDVKDINNQQNILAQTINRVNL